MQKVLLVNFPRRLKFITWNFIRADLLYSILDNSMYICSPESLYKLFWGSFRTTKSSPGQIIWASWGSKYALDNLIKGYFRKRKFSVIKFHWLSETEDGLFLKDWWSESIRFDEIGGTCWSVLLFGEFKSCLSNSKTFTLNTFYRSSWGGETVWRKQDDIPPPMWQQTVLLNPHSRGKMIGRYRI